MMRPLILATTLLAVACFAADVRFSQDDILQVRTANPQDLSRDGRWLVVTSSDMRDRFGVDNRRFGDPTYVTVPPLAALVVDTRDGAKRELYAGKRRASNFAWSPDGTRLAYYLQDGDTPACQIWNRETGETTTVAGVVPATNADPMWMPDSQALLIPNRTADWSKRAREMFVRQTDAAVVVHSSKDTILPWEQIRRMAQERGLVRYDVGSRAISEVLAAGRYTLTKLTDDGSTLVYRRDISKKTDYDVIFGTDDEVIARDLKPGSAERKLMASTKGVNLIWSGDGTRYAYAKEGRLYTGSITDKEAKQIAGRKADDKKPAADADAEKEKAEVLTPVRLSFTGARLVASNKQGLWLVDSASGSKSQIVKTAEDDEDSPRYQVAGWSIDGEKLYLSYSARGKWERGLKRFSTTAGKLEDLFQDESLYTRFDWSRDGSTLVFLSAPGNRPVDVWVANGDAGNRRRLMETNPQLQASQLGRTELITYLNADGKKMRGVLYYPLDYQSGRKYPTVFSIYEQFFDDTFNGLIAHLTANGYAVMQPSVNFETGFPGEAWVKAVTGAANKLIEMGVADGDRLGVHGVSYGGYATNLLITQTNRFKAAINISGKVNMVSFYTDSPRLGVRNIHAPEKSQDRLGATLWQQPQKYLAHSAILYADRIKTPLLLMSGEQDHNVPARQAMEMFYALKRLGKEVEWVSYTNSGHGAPNTTEAEFRDYSRRIVGWYDRYLKKAAAAADKPKTATE